MWLLLPSVLPSGGEVLAVLLVLAAALCAAAIAPRHIAWRLRWLCFGAALREQVAFALLACALCASPVLRPWPLRRDALLLALVLHAPSLAHSALSFAAARGALCALEQQLLREAPGAGWQLLASRWIAAALGLTRKRALVRAVRCAARLKARAPEEAAVAMGAALRKLDRQQPALRPRDYERLFADSALRPLALATYRNYAPRVGLVLARDPLTPQVRPLDARTPRIWRAAPNAEAFCPRPTRPHCQQSTIAR